MSDSISDLIRSLPDEKIHPEIREAWAAVQHAKDEYNGTMTAANDVKIAKANLRAVLERHGARSDTPPARREAPAADHKGHGCNCIHPDTAQRALGLGRYRKRHAREDSDG